MTFIRERPPLTTAFVLAALCAWPGGGSLGAAELIRVEGVVEDPSGAPLRAAHVLVASGLASARGETDGDGRFALEWRGPGRATLTVDARGFAAARRDVQLDGERSPIRIVLTPAAFSEKVTVTAARVPEGLGDTPKSVTVVTARELSLAGATTLDDALRQVPGFTLFRRTGSRAANPTAQGASLRGVGGSGASRAAVFEDGVPLNDPFGGWVYWGRLPRTAIDRVEVVRGGASDLYGSGALAGVVNVLRATTEAPRLEGEFTAGQQDIAEGSFFAGGRRGGWGASVAAEVFSTNGYFAVPPSLRGKVDGRVGSRHHTGDLTLERAIGSGRVFLRGGGYRESRANGTALQDNDTEINQGVAGMDGRALGGAFRFRADLEQQVFNQTFSAVAADRRTERLTIDQRVPARGSGASFEWSWGLGSHAIVTGVDRRGVRGTSDEVSFSGATPVASSSGGRQRTTGLFLEDVWTPARWLSLTGAVRQDRWRNFEGRQITASATRRLPDRTESATSPRGSVLVRVSRALALTGSAYRAFRAPTLNELYRSFRVGNVVTQANDALGAERLTGREAGALLRLGRAVSVRATAFSMSVERTIANVTLSTTPTLITRQRRNLGSIRSRGLELEGEARLGGRLTLAGAWTTDAARVTSFPEDKTLVGKRVAQVPRRQGSLALRYASPHGFAGAVQARFVASQFEDDQNLLALRGFTAVDALLSRPVNEWVELFVAVENLGDVEYDVGRTPIRTVGAPRTVRGGLRVRLRGQP